MSTIDELDKSMAGIDAGRNYVGVKFIPIGQHHAFGLSIFHHDFDDAGPGPDFYSSFARRTGNCIGDCAGATTRKPPGAERPVNFSHVVMEQNVSRSW